MDQKKLDQNEFKRFYARNDRAGERCWELRRNEKYGRYLVATRDIEAGTVMMTERPLMWGPSNLNPVLVCIGCCRSILVHTGCLNCGLPVCSQDCSELEKHRSFECPIFAQHKQKLNFKNVDGEFNLDSLPYDVILILRLLLLREKNKEDWQSFRSLASLLEEWKKMDPWEENQSEKIKIIREDLGLTQFSHDDILTVIAINCTNTFSKYLDPNSSPDYQDKIGSKLRGVYPMTAMMSHSCCPTAEQNIHDHSNHLVLDTVAIRQIKAGEEITISYTELLATTVSRQHSLLTSKLFVCQCERCVDPRERGSLASGVKCSSCLKKDPHSLGTLLPSPDPDLWTCSHCPIKVNTVQIQNLIFAIQTNMESLLETSVEVEQLERMLAKYSRVLQPGNAMLVRLKYSLAGLYGRAPGHQLFSLDREQIERKRKLCEETLETLNILQPGYSCRRGMILYELHTALLLSGRHNIQIDKAQGRKELKRSLQCLRDCVKILSVQPPSTFPGQLYLGIEQSKSNVEEFIKSQLSK